ncbi:hypothetical protein UXB74_24755, partial [Escherichia marmotae]|nr:hypothetical protein [Escherichia marmotae]
MRCCEVENHVLGWLLTSKTTLNHSNNKRIVTDTKVVIMAEDAYSSPITAVRQWRGYNATANVFNDVNRHLCDDSVFCLDSEGFA